MSLLTPSNALIVLASIVGLIAIIGIAARLFLSEQPLTYDGWRRGIEKVFSGIPRTGHGYEDYELAGYETDNDEAEIEDEKEAVEVNDGVPNEDDAPFIGPVTFETAYMTLRLTSPRLFADNWYEQWRAEFSQWAANEARKRAQWRRKVGLVAS